jgi:hypothetical protein
MRTKSKAVRRYSSSHETLEGHGTVAVDDALGLIDDGFHLIDGANNSAIVHAPINDDVYLGPDNGNGMGLMDGPSAFPVFMDVDDVSSCVNVFSEQPVTMGVLLMRPSDRRMV